jgi:hypothetical protein
MFFVRSLDRVLRVSPRGFYFRSKVPLYSPKKDSKYEQFWKSISLCTYIKYGFPISSYLSLDKLQRVYILASEKSALLLKTSSGKGGGGGCATLLCDGKLPETVWTYRRVLGGGRVLGPDIDPRHQASLYPSPSGSLPSSLLLALGLDFIALVFPCFFFFTTTEEQFMY